jgi:3-hydroxybutyryl-CoA dehydratase
MRDQTNNRGLYFEEFALGDTAVSSGRTITETDIVNFAGLSGDFSQIHTNLEFAHGSGFGHRIAHGLLGLSIASGLLAQLGVIEGTVMAFRDMSWKFSYPIYIHDTIYVRTTVSDLKAVPRMGGGAVTFDLEVVNQEEKVVQSGQWMVLVASHRG